MITSPTASPKIRKSVFKKQIPTLAGLFLLVAGLAIAAVLFGQGTGIFLPRATPETTPKNIRVSNISEDGFYVTFLTDAEVPGFVKYGTEKNKYTQVGDERDQLTGEIGNYTLHHIRIKGLQPSTTYYYVLGTGSGSLFDDNGEPFIVKTATRTGTQPKVSNAYGTLKTNSGAPAEGAVVFVTPPGAGTLSSLVRNTGSWAVSLSNARTKDGSDYASIAEGDPLTIQVQGKTAQEKLDTQVFLKADESIDLTLGNVQIPESPLPPKETTPSIATNSGNLRSTDTDLYDNQIPAPPASTSALNASKPPPTPRSTLGDYTYDSATAVASDTAQLIETLDLDAAATTSAVPEVETTQPVIEGSAPTNTVILVEIHSESQISTQVTSDANGNFSVDLEKMQKNLEPGDHTVTFSYVDPTSGKTITKTQNFVVKPKLAFASTTQTTQSTSSNSTGTGTSASTSSSNTSTQIALASPTPTPYGTNNPYPITSPTASASATPKPTATPKPATGSGTATTSGKLMNSGSVGTTALLLGGGFFFLISGVWSWWISKELQEVEA